MFAIRRLLGRRRGNARLAMRGRRHRTRLLCGERERARKAGQRSESRPKRPSELREIPKTIVEHFFRGSPANPFHFIRTLAQSKGCLSHGKFDPERRSRSRRAFAALQVLFVTRGAAFFLRRPAQRSLACRERRDIHPVELVRARIRNALRFTRFSHHLHRNVTVVPRNAGRGGWNFGRAGNSWPEPDATEDGAAGTPASAARVPVKRKMEENA